MLFAAEQLKGNVLPQPRIMSSPMERTILRRKKMSNTQPLQLVEALAAPTRKPAFNLYSDKKETLKPDTAKELSSFLQDDADLNPITEFDDVAGNC